MSNKYMLSCALAALLSSGGGAMAAGAANDAAMATASSSDAAAAAATSAAEPAAPLPLATSAAAVSTAPVDEIVVTAQRRSESLEKVPETVQAFSGATLDQLNVVDLEDLLKFTPNVTYATNGPGQGTIFMRGLSAGAAGNQSSATIAPFPNVALYLDDQSMQFPGRNVDVYAVDLERVEVLEGPQGTLFGGGAEAGALRYITNKPKLDVMEAKAEGSYGGTSGGGNNASLNLVLNVPIVQDKLAVRAVVFTDQQGGYIDNVPSTFTRNNNDVGNDYFNIKPTKGLCPNGLPAGQAGLCTPGGPQGNNYELAGNNFNPVTYQGARVSALYQVNDSWDVLLVESLQNLNAEGTFSEYPTGSDFQTLQPLQTTVFSPSFDKDNWENTAWTVHGKYDGFNIVYTGGYMLRHINQQQDYSNYSRSGGGTYYECTGSGTGFGTGGPVCYSPVSYWQDEVRNTHLTQELRVSTPDNLWIRGLAGAYWEQYRIYDNMNFDYKTVPACTAQNLAIALAGGATCVGDVETAPGSTANDPGVRANNTAFGEDTQRGYDQTAFFASVDLDVLKNVTITAGTRYYQYNEFEVGSEYYTATNCTDVAVCADYININSHNDRVQYKGFKSRYGINWRPTPTTTLYYLYSEGFRPGGFSRSSGLVAPLSSASGTDQYDKPNGYSPDSLTNNEIGVKTELFNRRLQVNVSAYYMDWDNVQLAFFNPAAGLGNTTFLVNGPNYTIKGFEVQFVARPIQGLTIQGSSSYNDDTQSTSPCLVSNVTTSPTYGHCITEVYTKATGVIPFENPFGSVGSVPAFSPTWQANLRARYEFPVLDTYKAFVAADGTYMDSMYNQPGTYTSGAGVLIPGTTTLRYLQAPYATFDASVGVSKGKYRAELFCNNLLDSHASTFTSSAQFIKSEVPLRPRIFGLKLSASY
jgi:outer membrane receptor protein involved in Fe transport